MAYNHTVLGQILKLVPRHEFEREAREHHEGRRLRKMTRWGQFVAMVLGQLAGRSSLRDIVGNLDVQADKQYHLGVKRVSRSSLARVNEKQPYTLYEAVFGKLLGRCRSQAPGHKFRFKNKLYSLDASTIDLCLSLFPWAKFRTTKGAVKVHLGLDHDGYLPTFVNLTDGKTSDIKGARALTLPQGSILVADRGYVDFSWLNYLYSQGIFLVTRLKRGACYRVCESRPVHPEQGVICDQTIELTSSHSKYPRPLRRVGYVDAATGQFYDFLTNHFSLAPKTIADIYKDRWQVELFFKWIKQHLKVKSFLGTSRNAVLTQLWIALCVYLLIAYIKFLNRISRSLYHILRLLQLNLFDRRPLLSLLYPPPPAPPPPQLPLPGT